MFYISQFCRVCLQFEKPLTDIMKKESEPETLINKLKLCVSEVEWSINENLFMCQCCIDKLNLAFEFKRQCLQSAQALANYISHLLETKVSEEHNVALRLCKEEEASPKPTAYIQVQPNQQILPTIPNIILTAANNINQNNFQNIFLNLIPTTALKYPSSTATPFMNNVINNSKLSPQSQVKDTNQNMFLNINNTLHKIFPIVPQNEMSNSPLSIPSNKILEDINISKLLTQSKTEELSVEIDPTFFDYDEEPTSNENVDIAKDWEELISSNTINPETLNKELKGNFTPNVSVPVPNKLPDTNIDNSLNQNRNDLNGLNQLDFLSANNLLPIRPKPNIDLITSEFEEKMMEFLNVDHFMAPKENLEYLNNDSNSLMCEQCGQTCDTLKALRHHIKQFHLGKFPYKCKYCSSVYALKVQYESHMQKHVLNISDAFSRDVITLEDLSVNKETTLFPNLTTTTTTVPLTPNSAELMENSDDSGFEHKCELCPRSFNSPHGLSRHRVRKHNQQTRRKYFIKGMKNAKCDICNREFSTQSYLQLHIKLHYRKNDYRLKVFNKDKYNKENAEQDKAESENEKEENTKSDEQEQQNTPEECKPSDIKIEETQTDNNYEEEESPIKTPKKEETEAPTSDNEDTITEEVPQDSTENTTEMELPKSSKRSKSSKGIKITINLRNLKKPKPSPKKIKSPPKESNKENTENDSNAAVPMEVDPVNEEETITNGQIKKEPEIYNNHNELASENKILTKSCDGSHDGNTDCKESVNILSPTSELSEEPELTKDDGGLPLDRRSSIQIEMVGGRPKCGFCDKLFHRKHDLKRHINNIHLKAIQYRCHLCNSQFYEAFHLTRHLRQHNGFVRCAICLKEFSVLRDLKIHMNGAHDNLSSCQCGTCDQVFERIKHLRDHMHEHDKSITYKCHLCNCEFRESRDLSKHLVEHSGMYSCSICHTTFSTEQEHNTHIKYHNKDIANDRKYECEICHNRYKKKRYLSAHVNNCHSVKKQNAEATINRVESENDSS